MVDIGPLSVKRASAQARKRHHVFDPEEALFGFIKNPLDQGLLGAFTFIEHVWPAFLTRPKAIRFGLNRMVVKGNILRQGFTRGTGRQTKNARRFDSGNEMSIRSVVTLIKFFLHFRFCVSHRAIIKIGKKAFLRIHTIQFYLNSPGPNSDRLGIEGLECSSPQYSFY